MKKAILLIFYGGLHSEKFIEKYEPVLQTLREKCPNYDIHHSYLNKKIYKQNGYNQLSPVEKVLKLKEEGYKEISVIPALLFSGKNYIDLKKELNELQVQVGVPLLTLKENVNLILNFYRKKEGKLLLIAHKPASCEGQQEIQKVNKYLESNGSTMKIFSFSNIKNEDISDFLGNDPEIYLYPLFVYSNYHIKKDIADLNSPLNKILNKNYKTEFINKTLIEEPFFSNMILHVLYELQKSPS